VRGLRKRPGNDPIHEREFHCFTCGVKTKVEGLSGYRCVECDEVAFDARSARRYADAGDELVLRKPRTTEQGVSPHFAASLAYPRRRRPESPGEATNAFSRYERGESCPSRGGDQPVRLLDKHPELLKDLA